jgi:hypothetical protein
VVAQKRGCGEQVLFERTVTCALAGAVPSEVYGQHDESMFDSLETEPVMARSSAAGAMAYDQSREPRRLGTTIGGGTALGHIETSCQSDGGRQTVVGTRKKGDRIRWWEKLFS